MSFKPKSQKSMQSNSSNTTEFVPIIPEDGVQAVQIGMLVNLGSHEKLPKFAKDTKGVREKDEDGNDKIIIPKEGSEEQKVAVYIDLLTQEHDYGGDIGVRNIRVPLHHVQSGVSEGINFVTVAPRDPDGNYIKGRPWTLAPASQWYKIASVTKTEDGKFIKDVIFNPDYKNKDLNNVGLLLGKPFMFNVEVNVTEKGDKKYVNTKLKSAVPLIKGIPVPDPLMPALSIDFDDEDLLEEKEELGGAAKIDLIRKADLRKIVLSKDYEGSNMQKAIQEKFDEKELISEAKETVERALAVDKELQEVYAEIERRGLTATTSVTPESLPTPADEKPSKKKKVEIPTDDDGDNAPF